MAGKTLKVSKKTTPKKNKKDKKEKSVHVEKQDTLSDALDTFKTRFGDGVIYSFTGGAIDKDVEVVSTGSILLDDALGIGGLPYGRVVEIYGPEGGGKTTLALHVISAAQKDGKTALFVDAEHALDPSLVKSVRADLDKLCIAQPDNGEQALDIVEHAVDVGQFGVIVIDSVSALTPRAEIAGEMGDSHMGLQARMMGQGLRKIVGKAKKSNTLIIFINQLRMKIGVVFGNPEVTSGGNALKFFSSVRLDIRRTGSIKGKGDKIVGNTVKIKVVKNKLAPPYKVIETRLMFGKGLNKYGELMDMAIEKDIVELAGSWITYADIRIQGKDNFIQLLESDDKLYNKLFTETRNTEYQEDDGDADD